MSDFGAFQRLDFWVEGVQPVRGSNEVFDKVSHDILEGRMDQGSSHFLPGSEKQGRHKDSWTKRCFLGETLQSGKEEPDDSAPP